MDVTFFPAEAFSSAKTLKQKLARVFNAKAYCPGDIRAIRTSVYYSNFETVESKLRYVMSIGNALRQDDGRFVVYMSRTQITEDPIRRSLSLNAGVDAKDRDTTILCRENEVIEQLGQLEKKLARTADYALAFPPESPLRLCGSLHIDGARLIFNHPNSRDEIVEQQKRTRHHHDRRLIF